MGNPEGLVSSGNLLHVALEARAALGDANLLQMLHDLGHPYGVMLATFSVESNQSFDSSYNSSVDPSSNWYSNLIVDHSGCYASFWHSFTLGMSIQSSLYSLDISGLSLMNYSSYGSKESEFTIHKNDLDFNTVSLNLTAFRSREAYAIKSPQGDPVAEIAPQAPLAFIHLNRQAAKLRQMSPLERIQTMTGDLKAVFGLIDNESLFNTLKPDQQKVITAAREATIIGISHLVKIFRHRTGLPFWKLDVLPQAVQEFHRLDSQAVSNQFGGYREVKRDDIEMMVITPAMRQQLAAVYA